MHSFLELKTPKDTVGISLNNKIAFSLYQQISKNSTIQNSKSGNLNIDIEQALGAKGASWNELVYPLKRLIEDGLILHLFYLSYAEKTGIKVNSCFISVPIEKPESIEIIYNNILNVSVQNILLQIEDNAKIHLNTFKTELGLNLKQKLDLSPENYPCSFIKIFPEIENSINEIPISERVKETILEEIEEELILLKKIVKLENGLYFPLSDAGMVEKFNAADEFLRKEVSSIYYSILGKELESIINQEEIYKLEPFQEPFTGFKKERAELLHRTISPKYSEHYPGELAIMVVLLFEKFVLAKLLEIEESIIKEEVEKYKIQFSEPSNKWQDVLHFIHQETINSVHPKVWDRLRNDVSLVFATWYLPKEEIYIFATKKVSTILICIKDMNAHLPDPLWKILAFKNLIEKNEHYFQNIFKDEYIVSLYGNLIKNAYIEYFPWYYPLLIYFKFFRDMFYTYAKKKIQFLQLEFESRIRFKNKQKEKERIIKYTKIAEEKIIESRRTEIIECLDQFYFNDKMIPTKQLMLQKCKTQNADVLDFTLKKFFFQIINIPGEEKNERLCILYPLDHEWRGRESRLKKMLSKKIEGFLDNSPESKKNSLPYRLVLNHIISSNKIRIKPEEHLEDNKSKMHF